MVPGGFDIESPHRLFSLKKDCCLNQSKPKLRRSREVSKENDENKREMIQEGPNDETLMLVERGGYINM